MQTRLKIFFSLCLIAVLFAACSTGSDVTVKVYKEVD